MPEKFRELAQTFTALNRRDADHQTPKMAKRSAADSFANALEKSLAKKRKSVYRKQWKQGILCVRFVFPQQGLFFQQRIIP
jgi:hypothetical protein